MFLNLDYQHRGMFVSLQNQTFCQNLSVKAVFHNMLKICWFVIIHCFFWKSKKSISKQLLITFQMHYQPLLHSECLARGGCLFLVGKLAPFFPTSPYFWRVIIQSLILKRSDPHIMICCSWISFWANLRVHVQSEVTRSEWDNNHLPLIWRLPLSGYHESGWFQVHEILITCHCRQDFLYIYDNFFVFLLKSVLTESSNPD